VSRSMPTEGGAVGLSGWVAPAAGRYQVWAALGMERCRAKCLVWTGAAP